jgi:succinoglycan biosynthesis protein ExoL
VRIVYFAQDLADSAVTRRIRILKTGGAELAVIGFRRSQEVVQHIEGQPVFDIGRTFDRNLAHRASLVLRRSIESGRWSDLVKSADAVLARNLEMSAIALSAIARAKSSARFVYECLDIHNAIGSKGPLAPILQSLERYVLKRSSALMVSSPGFVDNYFELLGVRLPKIILAENKQVVDAEPPGQFKGPACSAPWTIGWFGVLRCTRGFELLYNLAKSNPELVRVILRGQPTPKVQKLISESPSIANMRFEGPYRQDQLADIYGTCHFVWAIDYFQAGLNSSWLLPNRLYEGSLYGCSPLAAQRTETARWLNARGAGVIFDDPGSELHAFIQKMTSDKFLAIRTSTLAIPREALVWTAEGCRRMVGDVIGTLPARKS